MTFGKLGYALGALAILALGTWYSWNAAQLQPLYGAQSAFTYQLFFNSIIYIYPFLIAIAIALGGVEAYTKRAGPPEVVDGKIERHRTTGTFLEHWTNMVGFLVCLATGILLGAAFIFPRLYTSITDRAFAYNMHFVGIGFMLFALTYYLTDHILAGEYIQIIPNLSLLRELMVEYKSMFFGAKPPPSKKYFATQEVAFSMWLVIIAVIGISGIVKASAHIWAIPGYLVGASTTIHDLFFLLAGVLFVVHVVLTLVPANLPLLKSLITGHISQKYVMDHNALWYQQIMKARQ